MKFWVGNAINSKKKQFYDWKGQWNMMLCSRRRKIHNNNNKKIFDVITQIGKCKRRQEL